MIAAKELAGPVICSASPLIISATVPLGGETLGAVPGVALATEPEMAGKPGSYDPLRRAAGVVDASHSNNVSRSPPGLVLTEELTFHVVHADRDSEAPWYQPRRVSTRCSTHCTETGQILMP